MTKTGVIYGINGPVVSLEGDPGFQMNEMVYVGKENLVGEVIGLTSQKTTIQVYEETSGLKPGEVVTGTGAPVSVTLAPGILSNIFDGIERPLSKIAEHSGYSISRGISVDSLDTSKKWDTHITVKKGERLMPREPSLQRCRRQERSYTRSWFRRTWRAMSLTWFRTDRIQSMICL